jgi:hypothetical protein
MIGYRSLLTASYENFCFIRRLETGMMAERILRDAQKSKQQVIVKQLKDNKNKFNIIRALINIKLAFTIWKE